MSTPAWRETPSPIAPPPGGAAYAIEWGAGEEFGDEEALVALLVSRLEARGISMPESLSKAVTKRRLEYAAGRLCAAEALARLGVSAGPLAPNPDRSVAWPSGVAGSITHCQGFAWALIAPGVRGIGIDSESIERGLRAAAEVRSQVVTPEESKLLDSLGLDPKLATLLAFSAKEAVYKALAPTVGRFFGFEAFRIEGVSPGSIRGRLTQHLRGEITTDLELSISTSTVSSRINTFLCYH